MPSLRVCNNRWSLNSEKRTVNSLHVNATMTVSFYCATSCGSQTMTLLFPVSHFCCQRTHYLHFITGPFKGKLNKDDTVIVYYISDISARNFKMKTFLESCRKVDLFIVNCFLLEVLIVPVNVLNPRVIWKSDELDKNKSLTFQFPDWMIISPLGVLCNSEVNYSGCVCDDIRGYSLLVGVFIDISVCGRRHVGTARIVHCTCMLK